MILSKENKKITHLQLRWYLSVNDTLPKMSNQSYLLFKTMQTWMMPLPLTTIALMVSNLLGRDLDCSNRL